MTRSDSSASASPGRPAKFQKDSALEAAMMEFWQKGYSKTSLDDLVEATGASRGSLYKTFGDKRTIFLATLELYADRFDKRTEDTLLSAPNAESAMKELLVGSALRLGSINAPQGCLRCNSTLELYGQDILIDKKLEEINTRFRGAMERIIARGVAEGSVSPDSLPSLSNFYTGLVAGLVTFAKSGATTPALLDCVDVAMSAWGNN